MSMKSQFLSGALGHRPSADFLHELKRDLHNATAAATTVHPTRLVAHADAKLDRPVSQHLVSAGIAEQARHLKAGHHPLDAPETFVVGFDRAALNRGEDEFFRFIGDDERVDVEQFSSFETMTEADMSKILGRATVLRHSNGLPILSDNDRKVMAAALAVRFGIVENKQMSRAEKERILRSLFSYSTLRAAPKITRSAFIPDGDVGVRFTLEDEGKPARILDMPEAKLDALLGRSVAATEGALSDDERSLLSTAIAAWESLLKTTDGIKLSHVVRFARREHGKEPAERLRRFLLDVCNERIAVEQHNLTHVDQKIAAYKELLAWVKSTDGRLALERADGSRLHSVKQALHARSVIALTTDRAQPASLADIFDDIPQPFVIEHDWARAFAGRGDFDLGEVSLPYDKSVWEFQVSGRRVCLAIGETMSILLLSTKAGWVCAGTFSFNLMAATCAPHEGLLNSGDQDYDFMLAKAFQPMTEMLMKNVRAVAISLEAEVAETEVVRADYRLNQARARRGKLPLYDYHTVSLMRRTHVAPLPRAEVDPDREIVRRRCHFRRGHWRHFENHKTWIRWMLVGDPDLGFVDKHYRL